jgi:hypothetical protein
MVKPNIEISSWLQKRKKKGGKGEGKEMEGKGMEGKRMEKNPLKELSQPKSKSIQIKALALYKRSCKVHEIASRNKC